MHFIWLRCSCQASKTSLYIYQKIMIELHWTMIMPRDMKWGNRESSRNLSCSGESMQAQGKCRQASSPHWKTAAIKKKGGVHDMPDKKQFSPQHHGTFLSGNREPVPCYLLCFWASFAAKRTISFNFLMNVCPCWQTLWMRHFFLPIMA